MKLKKYSKYLKPSLFVLFMVGSYAIFHSAQARPTTNIYLNGGFTADVTENQAVGTLVGIITDTGSSNDGYTLTCDTPGFDDIHFQIVGNELQTATVFDYDNPVDVGNDNTYTICISSTIDESPQEQTFTIDVTEEDIIIPIVEKKTTKKSGSRRLTRTQVNQLFGTSPITTTTPTPSPSTSSVQQIQTQLISLLTQLIAMMKG